MANGIEGLWPGAVSRWRSLSPLPSGLRPRRPSKRRLRPQQPRPLLPKSLPHPQACTPCPAMVSLLPQIARVVLVLSECVVASLALSSLAWELLGRGHLWNETKQDQVSLLRGSQAWAPESPDARWLADRNCSWASVMQAGEQQQAAARRRPRRRRPRRPRAPRRRSLRGPPPPSPCRRPPMRHRPPREPPAT